MPHRPGCPAARASAVRVATIAALASVALGGGSVCAASAAPAWRPGRPAASASGWRLVYRLPRSGQHQLFSVTAPGRTSAWAVGAARNAAIILHWSGRSWHQVSIPQAKGFTAFDVQASSPGNVWISGTANGSSSELVHWNGVSWQTVPVPATGVGALDVISPRDVWVAANCAAAAGSKPCSTLWNWNGTSWRGHQVGLNVSSVAGQTADDVWAVGERGVKADGPYRVGRPYAVRWNGRMWRSVSMPAPRIEAMPVAAVAASGRVWVGIVPRTGRACALQRSGTRWRTLRPPVADTGLGTLPVPDGRGGVWFGPFAHWTGSRWAQTQDWFTFQGHNALSVTGMARISGSQALWLAGNMTPNAHTEEITRGFLAAGP
jgi:hypothetical protein